MLLCQRIYSQQICWNYKGSWSSWKSWDDPYTKGSISKYGTGDSRTGLCFKSRGGIQYFSFYIPNYKLPTKKQRNEHMESGKWFEYSGYVNYYVNDKYPTAEALAKSNTLVIPDPRIDKTPNAQRQTRAIINIAPFKHKPEVFNVVFDDIAIGIDIREIKFEGEKKHRNKGRIVANVAQTILLFPFGIGSWWWNPTAE